MFLGLIFKSYEKQVSFLNSGRELNSCALLNLDIAYIEIRIVIIKQNFTPGHKPKTKRF